MNRIDGGATMAMLPNPYFPLLVSDQAEVIRIYLELMRASGGSPQVASRQASGSADERTDAGYPGAVPDPE
jgi:hypothetical protein